MRIRILLLATAALFLILVAACTNEPAPPNSQRDWAIEGWKHWLTADYEGAETAFGNALKVDPNFAEGYGGLGWTYIREQRLEDAVVNFEKGKLYAQQEGTPLATRQLVYMGGAVAYEAMDEYTYSVEFGRYMSDNLLPGGDAFDSFYDAHVTTYDLYIILALDYYGLADETNTVWAINKMRVLVGEQGNYQFTTWEDATKEIERLVDKDPS